MFPVRFTLGLGNTCLVNLRLGDQVDVGALAIMLQNPELQTHHVSASPSVPKTMLIPPRVRFTIQNMTLSDRYFRFDMNVTVLSSPSPNSVASSQFALVSNNSASLIDNVLYDPNGDLLTLGPTVLVSVMVPLAADMSSGLFVWPDLQRMLCRSPLVGMRRHSFLKLC